MSKKKYCNQVVNRGDHGKAHMQGKTTNLKEPKKNQFFTPKAEPVMEPEVQLAVVVELVAANLRQ